MHIVETANTETVHMQLFLEAEQLAWIPPGDRTCHRLCGPVLLTCAEDAQCGADNHRKDGEPQTSRGPTGPLAMARLRRPVAKGGRILPALWTLELSALADSDRGRSSVSGKAEGRAGKNAILKRSDWWPLHLFPFSFPRATNSPRTWQKRMRARRRRGRALGSSHKTKREDRGNSRYEISTGMENCRSTYQCTIKRESVNVNPATDSARGDFATSRRRTRENIRQSLSHVGERFTATV